MSPAGDASGDAQRLSRSYSEALQPLVRIGVTGHRDVADPQEAGRSATEALCRVLTMLETAKWPVGTIWSSAPSATTLGYRIVSPLAEGADRIVAGLARSSDARLSYRARELVVPLPFRLEYYRGTDGQPGSDCSSSQSQAEFDRLRSAALWTRSLHTRVPDGQEQRDAWYYDVGQYVVEHCDLLFALWDGQDNRKESGKESGTAAIVRAAQQRGTPVIWIPVARQSQSGSPALAPDDAGPRLLARPAAGTDDRPAAGTDDLSAALGLWSPDDLSAALGLWSPKAQAALAGRRGVRRPAQEFLLERLARLEEVCRYARTSRHMRRDIAAEMQAATASGEAVGTVLSSVADWIIPAYVIADGLAKRYQRRLKVLNISVYAAAAMAVAFGALAAIMFPYKGYWRLFVVVEALMLVTLLAVQWRDLRKKCRDRWVAYRAMGEYFRIGRFLALVSAQTERGLEFDRFARLYSWSSEPSSIPWFAPVIGRVWDRRPDLAGQHSNVAWLRDYLIAGWIDGQIGYHKKRRDDHQCWDKIFRRIIRVTLIATVVIVLLHVVMDYSPHVLGVPNADLDVLQRSLAFVVIVLTSVATALNGYSGQQRHNYHYTRFTRMVDELKGIRGSLGGATTMEQLSMHVGAVRRVTLGETTNWYEGMQEQEIDSPS